MSAERNKVLFFINDAINGAWDLATANGANRSATSRCMALATLARLEFEGYRLVRSKDA